MTAAEGFNIADIIALVIILAGIILGFKQGLSGQMAMVLTGLGIGVALVRGLAPCRHWLVHQFSLAPDTAQWSATVLLVMIPIIAGLIFYAVLRQLLKLTFTTWLDRIGGAIGGGVTAAGIVLLVFVLLNNMPASRRPAVVGTPSWIGREIIGSETQLVQSLSTRIEAGENLIEKARAQRAGKREKWEE